VPKLWSETIDAHRRAVRDATMDATAALVAEHGVSAVTMSRIAGETGIGRATLYKYFPDVESILLAWHERQIARHLQRLTEIRDGADDPLKAVVEAYALIQHQHGGGPEEALLHAGEHVARARGRLRDLLRDLIADDARAGRGRDDVPPEELATFCLHALGAAHGLPSKAAVRRLVAVTLAAVRPPR
jgi:AcrR family transcriptional regulator